MDSLSLNLIALLVMGVSTVNILSSTEFTRNAGINLLLNGYVIGVVIVQLFRMAEKKSENRNKLKISQQAVLLTVGIGLSAICLWLFGYWG